MTCPSCKSPLEPSARFCGVCGYRLEPNRPPPAASGRAIERGPRPQAGHAGQPVALRSSSPSSSPSASPLPAPLPRGPAANPGDASRGAQHSPAPAQKSPARAATGRSRTKTGDEIYLNQVLNNRFRVESKIGEGGFGAVYRGIQLATGRKVALKLLHPEMTKDENLVARFRREGMVLCNLRDAHTITTYDFDQTPDGTLYIAMELLEGKSLHQLFHEQAPLEWKRVFKILTEMCSSLAEAHAQGIVHRDLKPENIYLETRSGNPEFVKILDFGIAKVMRGDTIDPQSPQLTATGQTLGTLEYMSPEQLMGKPLDGRSDVYALGVLAYEMITGRLPFPDAKGPAGLITAQLKQTPLPPSQANPNATLPKAADRAILKCLEKDKNNRFADVSALATALQEAVTAQSSELAALNQMAPGANRGRSAIEMMETRRGDPSVAPQQQPVLPPRDLHGMHGDRSSAIAPIAGHVAPGPALQQPSSPRPMGPPLARPIGSPVYAQPPPASFSPGPLVGRQDGPMGSHPQMSHHQALSVRRRSGRIVWWVIALLAIGAAVGTAMALLFSK